MARNWLFQSGGWEHGPIRRLRPATPDNQGRPYVESTFGDAPAWGAEEPETTVVGSGYFAYRSGGLGLQALVDATIGHVFPLTEDNWIFWSAELAVTGFESTPSVGDQYVLVRCAEEKIAGGLPYLAMGIEITDDSPIEFSFYIFLMNADGTWNAVKNIDPGPRRNPSNTIYHVVIALDTSTDTDNLFFSVDGGTSGALSIDPATIEITGHMLHDDVYTAGKGGDSLLSPVHDDYCSCEGTSIDDLPSDDFRQILYQPTGVVEGEDDFTGDETDVDDENDADVGDGDTDANVLTPTGSGDQQTFTFPDLVSEDGETATVEAVLLVWSQDSTSGVHKVMARIEGGNLQDLSGDTGGSAHAEVTNGEQLLWRARLMNETPEDTPAAWSVAKFNDLEAGLEAINTNKVGEFYAIPIGEFIARPTATAGEEVVVRRVRGLVV